MKAPCKDCESRTPECHGKCERYQAFAEKQKKDYQRRVERVKLLEVRIDDIKRMKRR